MARYFTPTQLRALDRLDELDSEKLTPAPKALLAWMKKNQITIKSMAGMIYMDRDCLAMLLFGGHSGNEPHLKLMHAFAIEHATSGEVPAWLWLNTPLYKREIRNRRSKWAENFDKAAKQQVLNYMQTNTADGVIRQKARFLSRLFNVQWGEVKRRAWLDAQAQVRRERANIDYLMRPDNSGLNEDGVYVATPEKEAELAGKSPEEWIEALTNPTYGK